MAQNTEPPKQLRSRIVGEGDEAPDQLLANPLNWRRHPKQQQKALEAMLRQVGWVQRVIVNKRTGHIVDGHLRVEVALRRDEPTVPVIYVDLSKEEEKVVLAAIDPIGGLAQTDQAMLDDLLKVTSSGDDELDAFLQSLGSDAAGLQADPYADGEPGNLSKKFMIPPFSVFNARDGWWQDRKRDWLALGIKSEMGRDAKAFSTEGRLSESSDTSIFDPVLCEIAYRWFSPVAGLVLDPFAGGSVRGVVAAKLGRAYIGCELRGEQVRANREQAANICGDVDQPPAWREGDSRNIQAACQDVEADMIFSCPPYADLEVYSDDPKDLSTMPYAKFLEAYRDIIRQACDRLKQNRFACFVVGEVRDKKGNYIDFVGDTVQAFRDAGLAYYGEAILVTAVGSLPIRAGKTFTASRKLGKTHQNVLVFVKGDGKSAAAACGDVDVTDALSAAGGDGVGDAAA